MDKDAITSILLLNIHVFAIAQRFSMSKLQDLAIKKLMAAEHYFRYCHLDQILSLIFEVTEQDDEKLRYRVFLRCVENYDIVEKIPDAVELLQANTYMAWKQGVEARKKICTSASEVGAKQSEYDQKARECENLQIFKLSLTT